MLSLAIEDEIERLKKEPEWASGDRNSVTLVKTPSLSVVLVALRKGAAMCGHQVEGPITLFVLSGAVRFGADKNEQVVKANGLLSLDKKIPHDVEALEDSAFLLTIQQPGSSTQPETRGMEFKIPEPLKAEHEELHAELVKATKEGGKIGEAAKAVARLLHPHFVKEEEYALPPLGLLTSIAEGRMAPEMEGVFRMTDRLKTELALMLGEHKEIVGALDNLVEAAKKQKKMEYARFAEKLILHARTEEEVLYPAAILIGEYLKLKLGKRE